MKSIVGSFKFWLAVMVVLVGLAIAQRPHGDGTVNRIQHLEQLVKCPSCENLSAYSSNSTSAIAVRHFIASEVKKGSSDTHILTTLESQYGPSILLSPSTSGWGSVLWIAPVLVIALLVGVLWNLRRKNS
jgi:cytochrome c-type biogenesis protein CcmH